ncbi:MAG: ATP-binding protein [Janthinobacterium lividum]
MRTPPPVSRQLSLFGTEPVEAITDVSVLVNTGENQWFERKGNRIAPADLAKVMIGFANADGGRLVVGIANGRVEGISAATSIRINDWVQAGRDHADPPVRNSIHYFPCTNESGAADQVLILDVEASETIHRSKREECFLRVGDETRLLGRTEERELAFDKGEANFDKTIVPDLTLDDLHLESIRAYAARLRATDLNALMRSRGIYMDRGNRPGVTQAGQLLFGLVPPLWSYLRYQKYDGTVVETGSRSNLRVDIRLEGTIPDILEQAQHLLLDEIGTVIRQGKSGRFVPTQVLPQFAWLEAIVNALTHRSYSLHGDGIHVRQFADRLEVQSPGRLPGLVRVENIKNVRFSRNPHIARILAEMTDYVRELNEGVPRMFQEMQKAGLREPRFRITDATVTVILYKEVIVHDEPEDGPPEALITIARELSSVDSVQLRLARELEIFQDGKVYSAAEIAEILQVTIRTISRDFTILKDAGLIESVAFGAYQRSS